MPAFIDPPLWTNEQLEEGRQYGIALFIAERSATLGPRYQETLARNIAFVTDLFAASDNLRDLATGQALAAQPALVDAARYLAGPPISQDVFDVLAGTSIAKRKRLDTDQARQAALLLETVLDQRRFPWLFETPPRQPTATEREVAIAWTAGLKTSQEVATELRTQSSTRQEQAVAAILERAGFARREGKNITFVDDLERGSYRRETLVAGTKCDIPARLHDGRLLLIECKVSNTGTNSVKRLNRECGGKAAKWRAAFGQSAVCAAVIAGVFRLVNLQDAQASDRLTLFWEHDLTPLERFLAQAQPS